jgi:hypothetical protein
LEARVLRVLKVLGAPALQELKVHRELKVLLEARVLKVL